MFVTHLESAIDGTQLASDKLQTIHNDKPLWVRYDLDAVAGSISKEKLKTRQPDIWRYKEFLPVPEGTKLVTLGEMTTPLIKTEALGNRYGLSNLYIKDESHLPTGSFKSRGMAMAITMARHFGVTKIVLPTAGNAGSAASAYSARANMQAIVFMPEDTPTVNQSEVFLYGARAFLVNGLINDCGHLAKLAESELKCFNLSTLREPYRIEGKKTMGLELAEQFRWKLPDVILYPTGGGTGLIGMWKAFNELKSIGWLESDTMPKMVAVQSDGCCPVVRAFESGERFSRPFENAKTVASGLRVPGALGDFMILDAIRESGGTAVAVSESKILEWMKMASRLSGLAICPETAACIGALETLIDNKWIDKNQSIIIFNTASANKYLDAIDIKLPAIDKNKEIDWQIIAG